MHAVVDRIEEGGIAVITVTGGGEMYIPVRHFGFEVREGMHLRVDFKRDEKSEKVSLARIKKLQKELS